MSGVSEESALVDELTDLVATTPGVTRLFPPTRVVPLLGAAQGILSDTGVTPTAAQVRLDTVSAQVTVSIGVDLSGPAAETGASVCSRLVAHLTAADRRMGVRVAIVHISD